MERSADTPSPPIPPPVLRRAAISWWAAFGPAISVAVMACGTTFYTPHRLPAPLSDAAPDAAAVSIPPAERYLSIRLFSTSETGPWTAPLQENLRRFRQFVVTATVLPTAETNTPPALPFGLDLTTSPPTLTVQPSTILLGPSTARLADTSLLVLSVVASDESAFDATLDKVSRAFQALTPLSGSRFSPSGLLDSARIALHTLFGSESVSLRGDLLGTLVPVSATTRTSHAAWIIVPAGRNAAAEATTQGALTVHIPPDGGPPTLRRGDRPFTDFPWLIAESRVRGVRDDITLLAGNGFLACGSEEDRAALAQRSVAVRTLLDEKGAALLSPSQYALERDVSSWLDRLADLGRLVGQRDTFLSVYAGLEPPRLTTIQPWLRGWGEQRETALRNCHAEIRRTGGGSLIAQVDLARSALATLRDSTPAQLPLERVATMLDGMEALWSQLGPDTATTFPRLLRTERHALTSFLLGKVERLAVLGPGATPETRRTWREEMESWRRSSCAPCARLAERVLAMVQETRSVRITGLLDRSARAMSLAHELHERLCSTEPDSARAVRAVEDSVYVWHRAIEMLPADGTDDDAIFAWYSGRTAEAERRLQWFRFASRPGTAMMAITSPDMAATQCLEQTQHFGPMPWP